MIRLLQDTRRELLAYCDLAECDFDDVHEWIEKADKYIKAPKFTAWVVLDENNRAICYLDESLGAELDRSKANYERQNYRIVQLTGVIG